MIDITLPDGSIRRFSGPVSAFDVAVDISKSLAKHAIVAKINGVPKDLSAIINSNSSVEIITPETQEGLNVIRHDAAHILAQIDFYENNFIFGDGSCWSRKCTV